MAIVVHPYGLFMESLIEGRIDVRSDPMMAMLVTSGYTFNQNTHKFKSAVGGELTGASGYVAGGKQITGLTPTYDSPTKLLTLPAGNLGWANVTFTGVVGAVVYMAPSGFGDAVKPLIAYIDFGAAQTRSDQAFYINWPASGIVKLGPVA